MATLIKVRHPKSRAAMPDWEALADRYCHPGFIADDPIGIPHSYRDTGDWRDTEAVAFLSALFSYGRREQILLTLNRITAVLGPSPMASFADPLWVKRLPKAFKDFYYRFNTAEDAVFLCRRLAEIYAEGGSLKALWETHYAASKSIRQGISGFRDAFLYDGAVAAPASYGIRFLFANPLEGSAAKRFNMFLRWMVRQDAVDFGLWADVTPASVLLFPLDTHVAAVAREYKITRRKSNDWKTAEEITAYFRKRCPEDPVRFDFALFGLGIERAQTR